MKHLLNTLYILSEDVYLSLDGENVVANRDKEAVARYPLHTLQILSPSLTPGRPLPSWGPAPSGRSVLPSAHPAADFWPVYAERAPEMSFCAGSSTA